MKRNWSIIEGNKTWMVIVWTIVVLSGLLSVLIVWTPARAKEGKVASQHVQNMLETHPYKQTVKKYMDKLVAAIDETSMCSQTCVTCADACVGEKDTMLAACIRLDMDCADICCTTNRLLSRLTETPMNVVRSQLQTCIVACQECGAECNKHAEQYEHCRICADACSRCAQACTDLLAAMQ
ncbi:MAG: four-helix bundle copper-binding protein [bacterium]